MKNLPNFIIIGAADSEAAMLGEQLARQTGVIMSTPKEPNFFSDDNVYAMGLDWYVSLFAFLGPGEICGEASVNYTCLPAGHQTVRRMKAVVPKARLIYVMRHPVERLIAHYIREWTKRTLSGDIHAALNDHPQLISCSRYAYQLEPFLNAYGADNILPVFYENMQRNPQEILETVCAFIGYGDTPRWISALNTPHTAQEQIRKSPLRDAIAGNSIVSAIGHALVPKGVREWAQKPWKMAAPPELTRQESARLKRIFNEELQTLGKWLGINLDCDRFRDQVALAPDRFQKI